MGKRILLSGATGFVGGHLYPALADAGHDIVCCSRDPRRARTLHPDRTWVELDLHRSDTIEHAIENIDVVYDLVHEMAEGAGYQERELQAARGLLRAAEAAGVERLVYLGGVAPSGPPSAHLRSRLETGRVLRGGSVPCIELRAGMIIGPGSASWRICRDLATRLPFMLLPKWLETRSQPIAIADVVEALAAAAILECNESVVFDLPGPEILTAKEILLRIAGLKMMKPVTINVPVLTPRLSSYWLKLVSGADFSIAKELVEGLRSDLIAHERPLWELLPEHTLRTFDQAAREALAHEGPATIRSRVLEAAAKRLARRYRSGPSPVPQDG